jgi:hypothetical protein
VNADVRRRLRALPAGRRRALVRAMRQGRAVDDPRDADLAAAWAHDLQQPRRTWPGWVIPRARPRGKRAWLWLLHTVWLTVAIVFVVKSFWTSIGSPWRWIVLGLLVYSALVTPVVLAQALRLYWSAPEAERNNRDLSS